MEAQHPVPHYAQPPPFSPDANERRSFGGPKADMMDLEDARTQRAASVLSGLSADDLEAAETLKSLGQDMHSPRAQQAPPTHIQTRTSFNSNEPEPLLSLITSQYPLAASVINGSISVYKTAQQFTPGGEWTERNLGLPLARTTAKLSGAEAVARWALQPRQGTRPPSTPDVEKQVLEISPEGVVRQRDLARGEQLPPYNDGDRSPPYSEHMQLSRDQQPAGWRQQLIITTSGLGVAMSDESIRSLKYCLGMLRWANGRLGGAVQSLKDLLLQWERRPSGPMTENDSALRQSIAAVKADVLNVLKQVVNVVSTYAGGALPENARRLVHQQLVSLPQRFSTAARRASDEEHNDAAANNANRALVLAQEGLDMMNQVSRVVNDTLVSAEDWIEKLGRRRRQGDEQSLQAQYNEKVEQEYARNQSIRQDSDVKMEM